MNHEHPDFRKSLEEPSKFKASTLCNIQAIRNMGYDKIEEQFKNRVNKTGVDHSFK